MSWHRMMEYNTSRWEFSPERWLIFDSIAVASRVSNKVGLCIMKECKHSPPPRRGGTKASDSIKHQREDQHRASRSMSTLLMRR
jgi:hypothetical protein